MVVGSWEVHEQEVSYAGILLHTNYSLCDTMSPEIIVVFTVAELRLNFFQVSYQFPKSYGRKLLCLDLELRV